MSAYILHCGICGQQRVHVTRTPDHRKHLRWSLLTLGLWLPVWILETLGARRPSCRGCGRHRSLKSTRVRHTPKMRRLRVRWTIHDAA
jgi:hypothetical protein